MGLSNDLSCEAGSLSCCRPNPHGYFHSRGLRLYFPALEPWVIWSATLPAIRPGLSVLECGAAGCYPAALPAPFSANLSPALSVYLCATVGSQGLLVVRLPAPFVPHSTSLGPATSRHGHASPLRPGCPSPPFLLIFYLLCVGLPCRSIFCQFWLCEEVQCVYLRRHLGSPISFNS